MTEAHNGVISFHYHRLHDRAIYIRVNINAYIFFSLKSYSKRKARLRGIVSTTPRLMDKTSLARAIFPASFYYGRVISLSLIVTGLAAWRPKKECWAAAWARN